jgi:hypothetical protein
VNISEEKTRAVLHLPTKEYGASSQGTITLDLEPLSVKVIEL